MKAKADWVEMDDLGNVRGSYNAVDPCWMRICEDCGTSEGILFGMNSRCSNCLKGQKNAT